MYLSEPLGRHTGTRLRDSDLLLLVWTEDLLHYRPDHSPFRSSSFSMDHTGPRSHTHTDVSSHFTGAPEGPRVGPLPTSRPRHVSTPGPSRSPPPPCSSEPRVEDRGNPRPNLDPLSHFPLESRADVDCGIGVGGEDTVIYGVGRG